MVDMENDQDVLTAFVHDASRKLLLSSAGNGFIVAETDLVVIPARASRL